MSGTIPIDTPNKVSSHAWCADQKASREASASCTLRRSRASASALPKPARSNPSKEAWYDAVVAMSAPAHRDNRMDLQDADHVSS